MDSKVIITDTNTWYNIGNNGLTFPLNVKLVVPTSLLFEIYSSPNLNQRKENDFIMVQNAIKALLKHRSQYNILDYNSIEYLIKMVYPELKIEGKADFYFKEFEAISKLSFEDCKKTSTAFLREGVSDTTAYYNEISSQYRQEIKQVGKKKFDKWDTLDNTKSLVVSLINAYINSYFPELPKLEKYESDNTELFLKVFNKFLRDIAKTGERVEDNDWNDLFFLVYVGQEMKFWTYEKKWIRKITELNLSNYLYEPAENN